MYQTKAVWYLTLYLKLNRMKRYTFFPPQLHHSLKLEYKSGFPHTLLYYLLFCQMETDSVIKGATQE